MLKSNLSRYGHLSISDSFQCPEKIIISYFLLKKSSTTRTICNTDNGHKISVPDRESKFV